VGFRPVDWELSVLGRRKADPIRPSSGVPKKFALKAEAKDKAINCYSLWGPHFYDIRRNVTLFFQ
jgi:hypothetical protein